MKNMGHEGFLEKVKFVMIKRTVASRQCCITQSCKATNNTIFVSIFVCEFWWNAGYDTLSFLVSRTVSDTLLRTMSSRSTVMGSVFLPLTNASFAVRIAFSRSSWIETDFVTVWATPCASNTWLCKAASRLLRRVSWLLQERSQVDRDTNNKWRMLRQNSHLVQNDMTQYDITWHNMTI